MNPEATVLICAYNRCPVTMECLRRLTLQTFTNFAGNVLRLNFYAGFQGMEKP